MDYKYNNTVKYEHLQSKPLYSNTIMKSKMLNTGGERGRCGHDCDGREGFGETEEDHSW